MPGLHEIQRHAGAHLPESDEADPHLSFIAAVDAPARGGVSGFVFQNESSDSIDSHDSRMTSDLPTPRSGLRHFARAPSRLVPSISQRAQYDLVRFAHSPRPEPAQQGLND
jgi:hypothetical protein